MRQMKQNVFFAVLLLLMMVALPVTALGFQAKTQGGPPTAVVIPPSGGAAPAGNAGAKEAPESIPVMRSATGKIETIGLEEYLRGCVAAEMPLSYHIEALKAQAVACCTYARYRIVQGRESLSDSGDTDQAYLSPKERREKWGNNYETLEKKLEQAVRTVLGQQVTWQGEPILAAFHSNGSGLTEDAEAYWGGDYPYLRSVASPGDRLCPEYAKTTVFTPAEIKTAFKGEEDIQWGEDAAKWFGKAESTDAGTVKTIQVGGKTFSGQRLRELLHLRSANFSVTYKESGFAVRVVGYGHGVGMSQYGADFMARQGSSYKEIVKHYYSGCEVG